MLFELISQRCERGATLITSNLPFDEWTKTFGSERLTGALLDRLVNILEMGDSFVWPKARAAKASPSTWGHQIEPSRAKSAQAPASYIESACTWAVIVALFRRIVIGNTECFQRVFVVQFMILPG